MDFMSLVYRGVSPNTLCCEAIVRRLSNGDLITVFQGGGPSEPHPVNRIYISRSKDSGVTWSVAEKLFEIDKKAIFQNEVFIINDQITVYLLTHNGDFLEINIYTSTSFDGGYSWSCPIPLPHRPRSTFARNMYVYSIIKFIKAGQYKFNLYSCKAVKR